MKVMLQSGKAGVWEVSINGEVVYSGDYSTASASHGAISRYIEKEELAKTAEQKQAERIKLFTDGFELGVWPFDPVADWRVRPLHCQVMGRATRPPSYIDSKLEQYVSKTEMQSYADMIKKDLNKANARCDELYNFVINTRTSTSELIDGLQRQINALKLDALNFAQGSVSVSINNATKKATLVKTGEDEIVPHALKCMSPMYTPRQFFNQIKKGVKEGFYKL